MYSIENTMKKTFEMNEIHFRRKKKHEIDNKLLEKMDMRNKIMKIRIGKREPQTHRS